MVVCCVVRKCLLVLLPEVIIMVTTQDIILVWLARQCLEIPEWVSDRWANPDSQDNQVLDTSFQQFHTCNLVDTSQDPVVQVLVLLAGLKALNNNNVLVECRIKVMVQAPAFELLVVVASLALNLLVNNNLDQSKDLALLHNIKVDRQDAEECVPKFALEQLTCRTKDPSLPSNLAMLAFDPIKECHNSLNHRLLTSLDKNR